MNNESALVSIIVPVYNIEDYIDECINSITLQTYRNIEVIVINDGSTDRSLEKCQAWEKRDSRIIVIDKPNEGLGPTRNLGVNIANGKWIAFIDGDDYIDIRFIEKLMSCALKNESNLVECNMIQFGMRSGTKKSTDYFRVLGDKRPYEEVLSYSGDLVCNYIIKKSILEKYHIYQPNCKNQDFAVALWMRLAAEKCNTVNDALYIYRKERPGSLSTSAESRRLDTVQIALPWLICGLKNNNLYEKNKSIVYHHVCNWVSRALFGAWMNMDEKSDEYSKLKKEYVKGLCDAIGYMHYEIIQLGSWSLCECIRRCDVLIDMNSARHFSSIISMCFGKFDFDPKCKNNYRRKMILKDVCSLFDFDSISKSDFLVFDLIEERHDLCFINNSYITLSDAYLQMEDIPEGGKIVTMGSDEWKELFKAAVEMFFSGLDKRRIIMVENYLMEQYGSINEKEYFDNRDMIIRTNHYLKWCYTYIIDKGYVSKIISKHNEYYDFLMTDLNYQYGCKPWYYNDYLINDISVNIVNEMNAKESF